MDSSIVKTRLNMLLKKQPELQTVSDIATAYDLAKSISDLDDRDYYVGEVARLMAIHSMWERALEVAGTIQFPFSKE